jgi:hypothetical protein
MIYLSYALFAIIMQYWICIVTSVIKFLPLVSPQTSWTFYISFGLLAHTFIHMLLWCTFWRICLVLQQLRGPFSLADGLFAHMFLVFWTHTHSLSLSLVCFHQILLLLLQGCVLPISHPDALSAIMKMSFYMRWTSRSSHNLEFLCSCIWKMFKWSSYTLTLHMHYVWYICVVLMVLWTRMDMSLMMCSSFTHKYTLLGLCCVKEQMRTYGWAPMSGFNLTLRLQRISRWDNLGVSIRWTPSTYVVSLKS